MSSGPVRGLRKPVDKEYVLGQGGKLIEYRMPLPMTLEEYQIGQLYMCAVGSQQESEASGGETGIEYVKNEPYEIDGERGQYTFKIYHILAKMPRWIQRLVPQSLSIVTEEAWNAYPFCLTQYYSPFFKDRLVYEIMSMHILDHGDSENAHNLSEEFLKRREVILVDIAKEPKKAKDYFESEDVRKFKSRKTGRGPFMPGWHKEGEPTMCAYKQVSLLTKIPMLQGKLQSFARGLVHDILWKYHRQCTCMLDDWHGMTMEDIRRLEEETKERLDRVFAGSPRLEQVEKEAAIGTPVETLEHKLEAREILVSSSSEEEPDAQKPAANS